MNIFLLENYIKEILKENKEFIKRINVFDFDMTLFKSTGAPKKWDTRKSNFWYNSEESLNQSYYSDRLDSLWIESTIDEVKRSMSDRSCLTVLCTARSETEEIMYVTNELLRTKGLVFDNNCLYYKPLGYPGSTSQYKASVIEKLLNAYSYCKEVHFWEDDQRNLDATQNLIDNNNLINNTRQILFVPHLVRI